MTRQIKPAIQPGWFNQSADAHISIQLRPYNFKEICNLYGLNYKAMKKLMRPIMDKVGDPEGRYYSIRQLEIIIEGLGPPYTIRDEG